MTPATALHLQLGFYFDSWGVRASMPQAMVSRELGDRVLVAARYRYYMQPGGADFHQSVYDAILPIMSGDRRLGPTWEHFAGAEVRWDAVRRPSDARVLTVVAAYEVSLLHHDSLDTGLIVSHLPSLGVVATY